MFIIRTQTINIFIFISIQLIFLSEICQTKQITEPIDKTNTQTADEDNWFNRFLINLLSYALVLIPSALLVFMVKNGLCLQSVNENFLVKLFVFGKNETIIEFNYNTNGNDLNDKLLPISIETTDTDDNPILKTTHSWIRTRRVPLLIYCFLGLQISYLSWGLLQEKIMTTEYVIQSEFFATRTKHMDLVAISSRLTNADKSLDNGIDTSQTYHIKFRNSQFLVLVNRILAFIIAFTALQIKNRQNKSKSMSRCEPPLHQYIYCSLSNILSSWCQYEALKFVSFPTQVLSKACKIMPVMLMSQLIGGKKYRTVEYFFAISISLGMTLFLWADHSANSGQHHSNSTTANESDSTHYFGGLFILVLYLTFDSFTSNWQTILFDRYKMSTLHMMAAVNFFSILLTSTSLIEQGDLWPAFQLILHNKSLLTDCLLLSIFSAAGQLFVFYTISTFGALVFVTIMTLRQAMAILLSCLVYNHSLAPVGLFGILIVFLTLFSQIYWKSRSKSKR